jgi:hypothetical protein
MQRAKRQNIYVYVDEAGQDTSSKFFIVVSVLNLADQEGLRRQLFDVEERAKTNSLKWQQVKRDRGVRYISLLMEYGVGKGYIFIGRYQKPIDYFFPIVSCVERAIKSVAPERYLATVRIDGINKVQAVKFTNALRANGISLRMVKGKTDESDVIIRLADMWAGCIRSALLNEDDTKELFKRAKETGYLKEF